MSTDQWTLDDLEGLLEGGLVSEDERDPLERLGRQIAGQYLDAILPFCTQVFQGPPGQGAVLAAQEASQALSVLASSTHDDAFSTLLTRLDGLMERAKSARGSARSGFLRDMRAWTMDLAELLEPEDGEALRRRFDARRAEAPLLDHLATVKGIGKRRIQRLYCAGLYTPDALMGAAPSDIAAVTGIPEELARDVIHAATTFEMKRRKDIAHRLINDADQASDLVRQARTKSSVPVDAEVVKALAQAVERLQAALEHLNVSSHPPET